MKAKDLKLRVVNETEEGKIQIKEFKPYMSYESFVGCIVSDAEILRPTGLKDKNGKEIYEGDIIEESYPTGKAIKGKIIYNKDAFEIEWISKDHFNNNILYVRNEDIEIIGNIYENQDLLE